MRRLNETRRLYKRANSAIHLSMAPDTTATSTELELRIKCKQMYFFVRRDSSLITVYEKSSAGFKFYTEVRHRSTRNNNINIILKVSNTVDGSGQEIVTKGFGAPENHEIADATRSYARTGG